MKRLLYLGQHAVVPDGFDRLDLATLDYRLQPGLPYADHSLDAIYCDQLERLTPEHAMLLLRECRRVLRWQGILRLATTDLDQLLASYHACPPAQRALHHAGRQLNQAWRADGRQWLYNAQELSHCAALAGLDQACLQGPDSSAIAALQGHPTGDAGQLILECSPCKPALSGAPLVSIVMPVFRARYMQAALDSALAQSYPHLEILVLDDSADDAIRQIVEGSDHGGRVRYIKNTPRLLEPLNLTRGIALARGELIKPLYDDDILLPDCVARMVSGMQACPDAVLALSLRYTINGAGQRIALQRDAVADRDAEVRGVSLAAFTLWSSGNYIGPPSAVMFRRDDALVSSDPDVMTLGGEGVWGAGDVAMYLNLLGRGDAVFLRAFLSEFRLHDDHTSSDPAVVAMGPNSLHRIKPLGKSMGLFPDDFNIQIKRYL